MELSSLVSIYGQSATGPCWPCVSLTVSWENV